MVRPPLVARDAQSFTLDPRLLPGNSRPDLLSSPGEQVRNRCMLVRGTWDHPRLCGEHGRPIVRPPDALGSSPLVRGTRAGSFCSHEGRGIIPAGAGNTRKGRLLRGVGGDHPRLCGEHICLYRMHPLMRGSSPLVRETRHLGDRHRCARGIIPACAGNTRDWGH